MTAPKTVWDAEQVKQALLPHLETILPEWGVRLTGKRTQAGWLECHAIDREDATPSAGINVTTGAYKDFGGAGSSLSIFDLAIQLRAFADFNAAVNGLGDRFGVSPKGGAKKPSRSKVSPAVPRISGHASFDAAVGAAGRSPKVNGKYQTHWTYHRIDGAEAFRIVRFETPKGKTYRPVHQSENGSWLVMDPPGSMPVYRLPNLDTSNSVYIFEGEKCCDLAVEIGLNATTSAHGAKSAHKTDWTPLAGSEVIIVPDAGPEGDHYQSLVAKILSTLHPKPSVRVLKIAGLDDGEDLEQWLEGLPDSWEPERCGRELQRLADSATDPSLADVESERETIPITNRFSLGILGTLAFSNTAYPRDWLVKRVMVKGRPGVVGGPKKSLKTSFVVDLVVSLGAGVRFLDQFDVPRPVKTLVISGESGEATIQETMRRVCRSKNVEPSDLEGFVFWGFTLPQLGDPKELETMGEFIRANEIGCVIIDPLYLCLISGGRKIDPANLFDVGPLLKTVCDTCLEVGATPLLVHHFRKNRESPFESPEMEDLAFAGIQEFARQWILLGRRERYEPGTGEHKLWLSVGGSDGHSGEWAVDVSEGIIDEDFRDREWKLSVSNASEAVTKSKENATAAKAERFAETTKARQQAKDRQIHDSAETLLGTLAKSPNRMMTMRRLRDVLGWSGSTINPVVAILLKQGRIKTVEEVESIGKDGKNRPYPGYEFVTNDLPPSLE